MSFIIDLIGRVFNRKGEEQEGGSYPVVQNGRKLNHLYHPRAKRDAFDECDRIMDDFMTAQGYRKYLTAEQGLPKPKRRFLKKKERMEVGDRKIMFRIDRLKK